MTRRALQALPLLVAALALGLGSTPELGLVAALLVLCAAALGPRFEVDSGRQLLSSAIGAGAGYVLTSFVYEPEPGQLSDGWAKLCLAALLGGAARALLVTPRGGYAATLALGFAALSFAGKTNAASGYTGLCIGFLLSGVWALGAGRERPAPRRLWVGAGVLLMAALLGSGASLGLSRLHAWAQGRSRFSTHAWQPRVGFSDRMDLGALDGLLDSDRRILRIRGAHLDYLRGAVLDVYEGGRWRRSEASEREARVALDSEPGPGAIEISAVGARLDRFFLPLAAARLSGTPSAALADPLGTLWPAAKKPVESLRLSLGPRERARPEEPRAADLQVPRRLARQLVPLARKWTQGAETPADKLRAIERKLAAYGYARAFKRFETLDPVLDFLFVNKRGHCEYFASALALLGRAAGVPTRVVMGFRVSEHSPFGYDVVRERNAHSWVEAWLPEVGWTTHDATPFAAQPNNQEHEAGYLISSLDGLAVAYADVTDWLSQRSLLETSLAWLTGCLVLALIVARGVRGRQRESAPLDDEALLAFMQPLLAALERQGHVRLPHEPLDRFAARLPDAETARLIGHYSALRYGGVGDAADLARAVEDHARALSRQKRAAA